MIEIVWAIALAAYAILLWVGFEAVRAQRAGAGYVSFIAAAILLGGANLMWAASTEQPLIARIFISGVVGALLLIGLAEGTRHIYRASGQEPLSKSAPKASPPNGKNSPTINAGGNVIIGHIGDITINPSAKNDFKLTGANIVKNADGTFTLAAVADITGQPASLRIEAWGTGILGVEAANRTSMVMTGHTGVRPDHAFTTLMQPFGTIDIRVRMKEQTKVEFKYDFNQ